MQENHDKYSCRQCLTREGVEIKEEKPKSRASSRASSTGSF